MNRNVVGSLFPPSHYQFSSRSDLPSLLHGTGHLQGANTELPLAHSCGQSSAHSGMGAWKSSKEMTSCKKVVVNTQLCKVLLERYWLEVTSLTPLSAKEAALEQTTQSLQQLHSLADAINTHLATYPRTSWEERLFTAGAHQVW